MIVGFDSMPWVNIRAFGITALYKCSPFTMWRGKLQPSFSGIGPCGDNSSVCELSWLVCGNAGVAALKGS